MPFSWSNHQRPIVALAPMAGVTDASYRQLIKLIAPEVIVYTEFLSTDALAYGGKKTMQMMEFDAAIERPFIVQVFGKDPNHFLEAAKVIEQTGADGIDINMGCPAAKVVSSCHGSALIRNPDLAAELVHATKKAVRIPVSVKTRLGWDSKTTLVPFCLRLVEAGAEALAIHGRRYCDKFGGKADWDPIYELKRNVSVPVLGNGDIFTAQDALDKIGNLDGVMVGRGTFGNPWLMKDIVDSFVRLSFIEKKPMHEQTIPSINDQTMNDQTLNAYGVPTISCMSFKEKLPVILQHCELAIRHKGEKRGMLEMRRHFSSYVKGFDGAREMREKLVRVETLEQAQEILRVS